MNDGETLLEKYGEVLRKIVELWKKVRKKIAILHSIVEMFFFLRIH